MKTSGESKKVIRSLFQVGEGGSIPTSPHKYRVVECRFSDIRHIFEQYHYKGGHMGGGISFCLALVYNEEIYGGAVMGKPRHESKYEGCIDIRRMALKDECLKNTESYFLSKIIWFIKKNTSYRKVLSYADMSVGHQGIIYKAANFKCIGETTPTKHIFWNEVRYHPRSLTIERPYSYKLREAVKTGEAKVEMGLSKKIYIYEIR
jgi:hypothetical protein